MRYTSAAGRQGEPAPGSEEQPLRDAVEQHEKEQKAEVDESKQPGEAGLEVLRACMEVRAAAACTTLGSLGLHRQLVAGGGVWD